MQSEGKPLQALIFSSPELERGETETPQFGFFDFFVVDFTNFREKRFLQPGCEACVSGEQEREASRRAS